MSGLPISEVVRRTSPLQHDLFEWCFWKYISKRHRFTVAYLTRHVPFRHTSPMTEVTAPIYAMAAQGYPAVIFEAPPFAPEVRPPIVVGTWESSGASAVDQFAKQVKVCSAHFGIPYKQKTAPSLHQYLTNPYHYTRGDRSPALLDSQLRWAGEQMREYGARLSVLPPVIRTAFLKVAKRDRYALFNPIAPTFSYQAVYPEEAEKLDEYFFVTQGGRECMDNLRVADQSIKKHVNAYRRRRARGCCGFHDEIIIINGKKFLVGFNYGH